MRLVTTRQADDDSAKFLWELDSGVHVESVLFGLFGKDIGQADASLGMASGATLPEGLVLCISSQAGCNVGCRFCATGLQPNKKNLEVGEITGQVRSVLDLDEQIRRLRVLFAGMGEPLLNYDNVSRAARELATWNEVEEVSISTVGVVPKMYRLIEEELPVRLFISLHATTDETRSRLIPLNRKYGIDEVLEAGRHYARERGRKVEISYLLLPGCNDAAADVERLVGMLEPELFNVELLLWNPIPGLPFSRISDERAQEFCDGLVRRGLGCYIVPSKAREVDAGCGQLITDQPSPQRLKRVAIDVGTPAR